MSDSRRKRYPAALRARSDNSENSQRQIGALSSRGRNNNSQTGHGQYGRMNSSDKLRKIVQSEGRTARNLISFNVPVQQNATGSAPIQTDRSRSRQVRKSHLKEQVLNESGNFSQKSAADLTKSPKSDSGRKPDLRARYWKFLFDNLQRAVDAIYETCEQDESALECREVIMMLEQSTRDFKSLIERLHVQKAFEDLAKDGDRPASIAWEVRKMSPGKNPGGLGHHGHTSPSPAQRVLNFSYQTETSTASQSSPGSGSSHTSGNSWADRVKGIPSSPEPSKLARETTPQTKSPEVLPLPPAPSPVPSSVTESGDSYREELEDMDISDGWETVQRGGKTKAKSSPSQRSLENLHTVSQPHHKLTRSISDPNASVQKFRKGIGSRDKRISNGKASPRVTENEACVQPRQRTDSKDSEKENKPHTRKPSTKSPVRSNLRGKQNVEPASVRVEQDEKVDLEAKTANKETESSSESLKNADVGRKADPKKTVKKDSQNKSESKHVSKSTVRKSAWGPPPQKATSSPQKKPPPVPPKPSAGVEKKTPVPEPEPIVESVIESEKTKEFKIDDTLATDQDQDQDQEDEKIIDDALASAMDEEDSLTNQLEQEQDQALESAIEEEESWLKELAREENIQIEVETDSELGNTMSSLETSTQALDWDAMVAEYDAQEQAGLKKNWGEIVEEADARTPGHAVHMHEKLSSPSRKRSPTESKKRHEEKQAKAQELRDKLKQEKSDRLKDLSKKVEEVRAWKEELMRRKKEMIEKKMQQAEEKRQTQLKAKAQKAHDEETKINEIAFINSLEAQNKRLDIMSKHQESEARLQDLQEERQRKLEEKLAKEAAVEERRKTLQAERVARLREMQQRRVMRNARIEQQQQEKEIERQETLRAKEKEREDRLAALNAQHEQHIQELQKKIQQKQDESTQRYQEALQQIREKAFEMSVLRHSTEDHNEAPQITPYDQKKLCTICNALIPSEVYLLSHLRGKTHQQALKHNGNGKTMSKQEIEAFNLKHIVDAPDNSTHPKIVSEKERQKSLKKRCKKLKQRMNSRGLEYETSLTGKQTSADSEHRAKMQKVIKDINKYLQNQDKGPWPQNRVSALDRALGEIGRVFDKKIATDQTCFGVLGGLTSLSRIIQIVDTASLQATPVIPQKSLVLTCNVFKLACKGCYDNCHYMLFSNKVGLLIELLVHQLQIMLPDDQPKVTSVIPGTTPPTPLPYNLLATSLMQLISTILSCLAKHSPSVKSSEASLERMGNTGDTFTSRSNDIISYIISVGIVDKLTQYFRSVQGPIDEDREAADFLQHSLGLLVAITKFMSKRKSSLFEKRKLEDQTQLISTFEVTELVGIVSLLYGMLLHSGTPSRGDTAPPEFPQHTLAVTTTGLRMLNHMATLDLNMMQSTLGGEGMSLEFRHIASYLIWYCSLHNAEELLHEVILCVGYFTVNHLDNQVVIQSGQPPTVLQQMCSLPFQYFSDPRLVAILFPTLISCCYNNQANREILEQELSCILLSNFIEEKQLEIQQAKLNASTSKKGAADKEVKEGETRMTLAARFPTETWTAAQEYFKIS